VQPIVGFSRGALWKIVDAELIDGAVNGGRRVCQHERRVAPASPDRLGAGITRRL
jgi:hypothetical protein